MQGTQLGQPLTISSHLDYACASFIYHVQRVHADQQSYFRDQVEQWLSNKFLYWLEVRWATSAFRFKSSTSGGLIQQQLKSLQNHCIFEWKCRSLGKNIQTAIHVVNSLSKVANRPSHLPCIVKMMYYLVLPFTSHNLRSLLCPGPHVSINCQEDDRLRLLLAGKTRYTTSLDGEFVALLDGDQLSILSMAHGSRLWKESVVVSEKSKMAFSPDGRFFSIARLLGPSGASTLTVELTFFVSESGASGTVQLALPFLPKVAASIANICLSPFGCYFGLVIFLESIRYEAFVFRPDKARCLWGMRTSGPFMHFLGEDHVMISSINGIGILTVDQGHARGNMECRHRDLNVLPYATGVLLLASSGDCIEITKLLTEPRFDRHFQVHQIQVSAGVGHRVAAVSPDGCSLALCSPDGEIQIWRLQADTWSRAFSFSAVGDPTRVKDLNFAAGGHHLIAYSEGVIRVWGVPTDGQAFHVRLPPKALVAAEWLEHGIPLGGLYTRSAKSFVFQYPFALPEGAKPLDWELDEE